MNAPAQQTQQLAKRDAGTQFVEVIRSPAYQNKFQAMLPPDVSIARFTEVVLRAVQEDPNLLLPSTDKPSLFLSCQRAASDGLLPDRREGALVMYGNKVQWQPMIQGLRKRLVEHGFDLRAEVVYENDSFDYELGDDPKISHKPHIDGDRGKVVRAYAIATHTDGRKYREVMSLDQLDAVAAISRAGNSGPWKGPFKTEMQRKTVARRLIKSLPIDDRRLQDIIKRDDEQYDLSAAKPTPSAAATRVQNAVRGTEPAADAVIDSTATDVTDGAVVGAGDADGPGF